MNEISNQSLQPATARASAVSTKSAQISGKEQSAKAGGNILPRNEAALKQPVIQKHESDTARTEHAKENIEAAVAKINEFTQTMQRDLQFKLDEASGRTVVTVLDRKSKEVIRQIPDEVFLKIARNLKDQQADNVEGNALHLINTRA